MFKERRYRLIVTVKEIRGNCPVFKAGDRIVVEPPRVVVEKTITSASTLSAPCSR